MRKGIYLLAVMVLLSGCTGQAPKQAESSLPVQSSVQEEKDIGKMVKETFENLWRSHTIFIDAEMTVEENEGTKTVYHYVTAADKQKKLAMLKMEPSDGTKVHYILRDGTLHEIDEQGNDNPSEYSGTVENFIRAYTSDLNLGVNDAMTLTETGTADWNGKTALEFAKYRVSSSEKISITYYFDNDKPYAQVMQSERGKTTFLFREITDTVKDTSIFAVKEDNT